MSDIHDFEQLIDQIVSNDARFTREAYYYVREALDHTVNKIMNSGEKRDNHHICGQELLEGIREFSLDKFGPMTKHVLNNWGIKTCEDFGAIVFNMVEAHILGKTDRDSPDDFKNAYSFADAFEKPFAPSTSH